jgi:glycosyltransferase involved in cell wall biosynthesis
MSRSVLVTAAYADGAASTNRALNIAEGFQANGYAPTLFSMRPHTGPRHLNGFECLGSGAQPIEDLKARADDYDAVFLVGAQADTLLALEGVPRRYVLIHDVVEDPLGLLLNRPMRPYAPGYWTELRALLREVRLSYRRAWRVPDIITVISGALRDLVFRYSPGPPLVYLPIIGRDCEPASPSAADHGRDISHCGSMSFAKDDIWTLLRALRELRRRSIDVRLHFFGYALRSELFRLRLVTKLMRIDDAVVWHGLVEEAQLKQHLRDSAALVLTKGDNRQNRFNFSTRLIDYLGSRRPCILSRVGEPVRYFSHGKNALIFEPGDYRGLADAVQYVFADREAASEIGAAGCGLLQTEFNATHRIAELVRQVEIFKAERCHAT